MAKADTKHSRAKRGGYGTYTSYDDEGRGNSKYYWTEFESLFTTSGFSEKWLMATEVQGLDPTLTRLFQDTEINDFFGHHQSLLDVGLYDGRLWSYITSMRDRFNVHDWAWDKFDDSEDNDGRMRRLIVKKLGLEVWRKFQIRAHKVYLEIDEKKKTEKAEKADKNAQDQAVFDAEHIKRRTTEVSALRQVTDLIAGAIRSEFDQAFKGVEVYAQDEGDWLDDPVAAVSSGYGFGEEVRRPSGIKLQVTVSLDLSNSMYNNDVFESAAKAFRDIYVALEALKEENEGDLYICAFTFSNDGYRAGDRGRRAENLTVPYSWKTGEERTKKSTESHLGAVESFRAGGLKWHFRGEDTWFYPLFERIEQWEKSDSESGAVKLDIIITDAVIEHPSDIRRSDVIQERRDGDLQTVLLNFLPEEEWVDSDLPSRCVQYPANVDNIAGLLRNLLTEFVSVYL